MLKRYVHSVDFKNHMFFVAVALVRFSSEFRWVSRSRHLTGSLFHICRCNAPNTYTAAWLGGRMDQPQVMRTRDSLRATRPRSPISLFMDSSRSRDDHVNNATRSEIFHDPGHQVDIKVLVELCPPSDYAVHPIKDLSAWLAISMLLKVIHESLDATESRGTSTFSTAEHAAEVGL